MKLLPSWAHRHARSQWDQTKPHKRRGLDPSKPHGLSARPLIISIAWWGWMFALYFAAKAFVWGAMSGVGETHQHFILFVIRDVWASSGGVYGLSTGAWFWLFVGLLGNAAIYAFLDSDDMSYTELGTIIVSVVLAILVFAFAFIPGNHDSDKDVVKYLEQSSSQVICVHDPALAAEHPSSLSLVYQQKRPPKHEYRGPDGKIDRVTIGDITLKRCDLPVGIWHFDPRSSSYDAAQKSLSTKTSTRNGVNVWDPTITYVYGDTVPWGHGPNVLYRQFNRWSALLDGSGYVNPLSGVAEWEGGQNIPHTCLYGDDHNRNNRMNRAFQGAHLNNMRNVIAGMYPRLLYQDNDIAGFCDQNDHPVIVISVTEYTGYLSRAVQIPAGILVIKGSPSGNPVITYHPNVKAGEYPVPVYPLSVAQQQREVNNWWAGRGNNSQFGYTVSTYASQADNSGEYVLRSKTDGGIYAVTPQKPDNSRSQEFVNNAMIRVDSVHAGHLNLLTSYVLPDGSKLVVNPANLNSAARALLQQSPDGAAFLAGKGVIKEFLPLTTTEYRGYGEDVNGNTTIYFDLSTRCGATATVVTVDPNTGGVQNTTRIQQPCSGQQQQQAAGQIPVNDNACAGLSSIKVASPSAILACEQALNASMTNRLAQASGTIPSGKVRPTPAPSGATPVPSGASPSPSG